MDSHAMIIKKFLVNDHELTLRKSKESDVPELRVLINSAYKELSDKGLNYTATYQDEAKTQERLSKGQGFVLTNFQGKIIATILMSEENYFTQKKTAYLGQFAVLPTLKKQGLGSLLLDFCEQLAKEQNYEAIQLDTAIPADHLVKMYLKRGYKIVGEIQWEGKTYLSYMFEKKLI